MENKHDTKRRRSSPIALLAAIGIVVILAANTFRYALRFDNIKW